MFIYQKKDEKTIEEEQKFGVYFEDEYNYMQHLKDVNEVYSMESMDRVRIEAPQPKKQVMC